MSWLKYFSHSNLLYVRVTKAIVNYTLIGKYHLRFFLWENFVFSCSIYLIKTKRHILYNGKKYNNYWNPRRDTLAYFTLFLEFNSNDFSERESIT